MNVNSVDTRKKPNRQLKDKRAGGGAPIALNT